MTTVSDLMAALNRFDASADVSGADTLTVAVTTNVPVITPPVEPVPDPQV